MVVQFARAACAVGLWLGVCAFGQDAASGAAAAAPTDMAVLQPAVLSLQQAVDSLRVEKWKASKEVKAATTGNIGSIRRNVANTLPDLVTTADAAPGSVAAMLPLTRNVGALYDVVLRVTVIAESAAPVDQAEALEKSLHELETARRTLADRSQLMATAEAARISDLQRQLNARPIVAAVGPPVIAPAAPKSPPAAVVRRKKRVRKPTVKTPTAAAKAAGASAT